MRRRLRPLLPVLTAAGAMAVYFRCLAPSIVYGDGPELTTAAYQLGVAHPPGYPLWTLLAHALIRLLPFRSPAWRVNLLSALAASVAVALVCLLAKRLTSRWWTAAVAALLFAFGVDFWDAAVSAEVYTLHMALFAAVVYFALRWDRTGDRRYGRGCALALGLGLAHHLTIVWAIPAVVFLASTSRHRRNLRRDALPLLACMVGPLVLYLHLPWAALRDPPENLNDPRTLARFLDHVTAEQYRYLVSLAPASLWTNAVRSLSGYLVGEVGWGAVVAAIAGLWSLWRRCRREALFTVLLFGTSFVGACAYNIEDIGPYFLPLWLVMSVWAACGLRQVQTSAVQWLRRVRRPREERRRVRAMVAGLSAILPMILLASSWSANDHSDDYAAVRMTRAIFDEVARQGVLVAGADTYGQCAYMHYVEGLRPDVELFLVYDLTARGNERLVTRRNGQGLSVRIPEEFRRARGTRIPSLLAALMRDNPVRPFYFVGEPADWARSDPAFSHWFVCDRPPAGPLTPFGEARLVRRGGQD